MDKRTLTFQESLVVSWTGMRGVVTLAAASGIPATLESGEPFPERAAIQAIAFVVAVGTILIQGTSLPWLIARLHLHSEEEAQYAARETSKTESIVHFAGDGVIEDFVAEPPATLDAKTVEFIRSTVARQVRDAEEMPHPEAHTERAETFAKLYREVLAAQRLALIASRDAGEVDDEAVRSMLERLDLQEAGLSARLESRL
jgi:CPA1 family monovalent cation:H+ antiporter